MSQTNTTAEALENPLVRARRRDVAQRRERVQLALAKMRDDGSEITVSATAARARVHRAFIHRHTDLHAAVLAAAAEVTVAPAPVSTAMSHRSVLAENANLHGQNRRHAQHIRDLEDRLSDLLGRHAFERSGLGAPVNTAALQAELEAQQQANLDLKRILEERDQELAAVRNALREAMNQHNSG